MPTIPNSPDIIIEETIDGRPIESEASAEGNSSRRKKRSKSAAEASTAKSDKYIWGLYIMLLIISCIEVFSASSSQVSGANVYKPLFDHVKFLALGFVIVLVFNKIHYKFYKHYATAAFIACVILLLWSTFKGADINGAKRAIDMKFMTIQPPEMMKLAMVLFMAKVMSVNQRPGGVNNKGIIISATIVVLASAVLWINGLTNAAMVMMISIAMFLIGGIEWKKFGIVIGVYLICGGALFLKKYDSGDKKAETETTQLVKGEEIKNRADTHEGRLKRFFEGVNANDKITDDNRQVMYSHFALANGSMTGQGPGNSRESARLPLAFSDYIYSIIVEDTGFIGGVCLLLLYLCLLARAGRVASKCRRAFPAILIMGCAVMIVLQALVHMSIAVGLGPVSGQPLPFISKGGTSIIVMSAAIGMMLSISRDATTAKSNRKEMKDELKQLPEDMLADNPTMISGK